MAAAKKVLEPQPTFSRELGFCISALEEVRAQTVTLLEDMTPNELCARVMPGAHQVGGLALHLAECEFWWIEVGLAKKDLTDEDRKFAHIYDSTETEFSLKSYTAADCIAVLDRVHQRALKTLSNYSDNDLATVFTNDAYPNGFEGDLRWILHRLTDHEANHKGQIAMIKRMIRSDLSD
jgi:uncharacterized damage-inducible protein DinB